MPGADAFLGKITPAMLARADRLAWVQSFTASLEHYMFPELEAHACVLTNVRGLFGDVIADQVLGYVLCFARNLHIYVTPAGGASVRAGGRRIGPGQHRSLGRERSMPWTAQRSFCPIRPWGSSAWEGSVARSRGEPGLLGFPSGGGSVSGPSPAARGRRRVDGDRPAARAAGLERLRGDRRARYPGNRPVVRCGDAGPSPPTSYLINIGRGAIVVLDDLVAALRAGKLAGAALDVYEVEPLPADHPLWDFPNVILTPHTAGYSPVIAAPHLAALVENVGRFARGEPLINVVNKALWF